MPNYLPVTEKRTDGIRTFPKRTCKVKRKLSHPGFELESSSLFLTEITNTPQELPDEIINEISI